ncbi:hypothetical protein [Thermogutta sp.]|nr:hypothetical protein [Thermogutta sp.]
MLGKNFIGLQEIFPESIRVVGISICNIVFRDIVQQLEQGLDKR